MGADAEAEAAMTVQLVAINNAEALYPGGNKAGIQSVMMTGTKSCQLKEVPYRMSHSAGIVP